MLMMLTYLVLYFPEMKTVLSWKSSNPKDIDLNRKNLKGTALKINVGVVTINYYVKKILQWCITVEGLGTLVFTVFRFGLIVGYSVGIWALATKTSLLYNERVAVTVGYAIGVPAFLILLFVWVLSDSYQSNFKGQLATLMLLLTCMGVGTPFVFHYTPLSHSQQVSIAVGMCVGVPCVSLLWLIVYQESWGGFFESACYLLGSLAIQPPILWAIIAKSTLGEDTRISLSVGLAVGLPALVGLWRYYKKV